MFSENSFVFGDTCNFLPSVIVNFGVTGNNNFLVLKSIVGNILKWFWILLVLIPNLKLSYMLLRIFKANIFLFLTASVKKLSPSSFTLLENFTISSISFSKLFNKSFNSSFVFGISFKLTPNNRLIEFVGFIRDKAFSKELFLSSNTFLVSTIAFFNVGIISPLSVTLSKKEFNALEEKEISPFSKPSKILSGDLSFTGKNPLEGSSNFFTEATSELTSI